MKKYKVHFSRESVLDLDSIKFYIVTTFQLVKAADYIVKNIYLKCDNLKTMPNRNPVVFIGESGNQYRRVKESNYNAFYLIHEETNTVEIVRVLYCKMNYSGVLHDSFEDGRDDGTCALEDPGAQ